MAIARRAPGGGDDGRMPAAQLRAVDDVVVDERGGVHQLDSDGGAHEAFLARGRIHGPAGGLGGEHDQERTQALAAGHDGGGGMLSQRRARRGGHRLEVLARSEPCAHAERLPPVRMIASTASMSPGDAHRGLHHRSSFRRHGAGVDRDDAAGEQQIADLAKPGARQLGG